ncbi:MAG: DUF2845 domain-containing protein [Desulfuromonadaceae bacterium]|nr:DUF2845 domain-containing protein [Desulfuromonadaceae bacterium]
MKTVVAACAIFISCTAVSAFADSFRCPNGNLISTGDSISTAALKCDPPAHMYKREEPVETEFSRNDGTKGSRVVSIEVQEWTYTKDSNLLHTVIFRNGILTDVLTGGFIR